jgi:anti-sigma factor RsiW
MTRTPPEQQLSAYIDGELDPGERAEVEQWLARDAEARALVAELGLLRGAVEASLSAEAAKVPEARFEQIWDEIDRALDRETAVLPPAVAAPSLWSRIVAVVRPVWAPVAATAVVAGVAVAVVSGGGVTPAEEPAPVAVKAPAAPIAPAPALAAAPEADPAVPDPELHEAHIERIEFGGKQGRIGTIEGKRGTTTVIWISDDDAAPVGRRL